jgi:hypothetical protein
VSRRYSDTLLALNGLFANLAHRARTTEYTDKLDRYLRLALKAQGQCRATLETLAAIKNPPTVIARQANFAHGPQQVNNGAAFARPGIPTSTPKELLGVPDERLDSSQAATATTRHPALAAVGTLDRAAHE